MTVLTKAVLRVFQQNGKKNEKKNMNHELKTISLEFPQEVHVATENFGNAVKNLE